MLRLIPSVKVLTEKDGRLKIPAVFCRTSSLDPRLASLIKKLPSDSEGTPLTLHVTGSEGEGYTLDILPDAIQITADSIQGAFYALQTLRQIFANGTPISCLHIEDKPDFPYRGFYHDVTRGKIPTVKTIKELVDHMAYYKLNSLQLYVEHVFEFEQTKDILPRTGYISGKELEEIDAYCKENFIEFIPSLATFGHLYELLEQPAYQHLRVYENFPKPVNFWEARMLHHTIDPQQEESLAVIQSLLNQYEPHFTSDYFNICCDETFDLQRHRNQEADKGQMYVDFVNKIIDHVSSKGKKVMMWGDILLKHPETISCLPEDTVFLNWDYSPQPSEEKILKFAALNRPQIVCPGTTSWSRLVEKIDTSETNISLMAKYGYKHGALGVLNTNWGDWGNPCSIELSLYGLALGAEKSWSVQTPADDEFHAAADTLVYGKQGAFAQVLAASRLQNKIRWNPFSAAYFAHSNGLECTVEPTEEDCRTVIEGCKNLTQSLAEPWGNEACREELLTAIQGIQILAEGAAKMAGYAIVPTADVLQFTARYTELWRKKNKESELRNILTMLRYVETI